MTDTEILNLLYEMTTRFALNAESSSEASRYFEAARYSANADGIRWAAEEIGRRVAAEKAVKP